jgi:disulfide bond formation protein DsbB
VDELWRSGSAVQRLRRICGSTPELAAVVSPEFATCGRDFYGMIEHYSFSRSIPMIFQGSGDCAAIDWTLLGGSIANWSFVCFAAFTIVLLLTLLQARKK